MPVKVRCASCEKVFAAPDAARGKAVKCPQCESRVAVPDGNSEKQPAAKAVAEKTPKKVAAKAAKPPDSEDVLSTLDLRRVEDTNARICHKCGFDMQSLDEEETECPKCGYDIESGGLGAKAKKRQMRGPDPADFYPGLAKGAWKFMVKNQMLAWRTVAYTLGCLVGSMICALLYLWISQVPPRAFFALCFFVAFLVIPGWLWNLDTEVIKLTLERKDKFKKLNFDFFLASSKGVMFAGWMIVGGLPILAIPLGVGYYMVRMVGQPEWVMAVCAGVGMIPVLWVMPIVMAHMTMPIPTPGWMVWKVLTFASRTAGALSVSLMWLFVSSLPLIGGALIIALIWGQDIVRIVGTMESNADRTRKIVAAENAPKGGKKSTVVRVDPKSLPQPEDVDLKPLIAPAVVLLVMCVPLGFIGMFNMRIHGQFTYYFKDRLELIDKLKEYKYVAKERRNEDEDEKPRTLQQDAVDGIVFAVLFVMLGGIGGMLYGALSDVGIMVGIITGLFYGADFGSMITGFSLISVAFGESVGWGFIVLLLPFGGLWFISQHWEKTRKLFFQTVALSVLFMISLIAIFVVGVSIMGSLSTPVNETPPPQQQPAEMMPAAAHGDSTAPAGSTAPAPATSP